MMWQAEADVARGTSAWMRRGTGATWQEATRVHTDAREGHHVEGGSAGEGPTG